MNGKDTIRGVCAVFALLVAATAVAAQEAAPKRPGGAIGDLTAIDAARGALTIKTTAGAAATAKVTPETEYLLIEPGKTSLEGAEKIALADVKLGDRVWARGEPGTDGTIEARQIVLTHLGGVRLVRSVPRPHPTRSPAPTVEGEAWQASDARIRLNGRRHRV